MEFFTSGLPISASSFLEEIQSGDVEVAHYLDYVELLTVPTFDFIKSYTSHSEFHFEPQKILKPYPDSNILKDKQFHSYFFVKFLTHDVYVVKTCPRKALKRKVNIAIHSGLKRIKDGVVNYIRFNIPDDIDSYCASPNGYQIPMESLKKWFGDNPNPNVVFKKKLFKLYSSLNMSNLLHGLSLATFFPLILPTL
jgi:hypothetical protein